MSKTFCRLPWTQLYVATSGHQKICCMNDEHITKDDGYYQFNMKKDQTLEHYYAQGDLPEYVHSGKQISEEVVKDKWEKHRSCFIEKVRFENIYNRLIMYDAKEFHAANSYYTSKDNRLTLLFFIGGIRANKWPLERIREIKC